VRHVNFECLQTDELWAIHEQVGFLLASKLQEEKRMIEARLVGLRKGSHQKPKYRNPDEPSKTWSGRGRSPTWVRRLLAAGKTMEDLRALDHD
jgi:DNA-binding protein H-NS